MERALKPELEAEIEQVEKAISFLEIVLNKEERSVIELSAIGTFIHNFYNGIENMLKRIFNSKNILIPQSSLWHKMLLQRALTEKIISTELCDILFEFLSFRHYFIHGYGHQLKEDRVAYLAYNVKPAWIRFLEEIKPYIT